MKKSKFLKKSLAMLLALMLVLAMIPLSASAAAEDHIDVLLVNGKQVARNGDNLSVTVGTTTVSLDAVVKDGVDLYYVDSDKKQQLIDLENGTSDIELTDGYATDVENQYAMNIIAKVKENAATDDEETEYTYPLTITVDVAAASTDTSLAGLAEGNPAWNDMVDYTIDNVTHNITVTLGFGKDKPIDSKFNHSGLDFEPTADGASVTYHDPENITVVSPNGDTQDYTIKYVNEPGFLTFTVPNQVGESKITSDGKRSSTVEINVPYGYNINKVVPTFTIAEGLKKVTIEGDNNTPVISGTTEWDSTKPLYIWYGDGATADWGKVTVKLIVPPQNPEGVLNDITVATGSTAAESSAKTEITGSTTFVEMPADTNIATATYNVTVNFSKGATVTLTDANGEDKYDDSTAKAGTYKFTGVEVIGEGHSFVIKVVSEDTNTTNTYTIQLGKPDAPAAELANFVFKDPVTQKEYKAVWNGTDGTITMPYAYRAAGAMDGVQFFFKASAGATVKYVESDAKKYEVRPSFNGVTVYNSQYAAYFPEFDETHTYEVIGSDGTTTKTFTITLKTEPAQTGRVVTGAEFVGTNNSWEINESNTYAAEVTTATLNNETVNIIEVTVPYSYGKDGLNDIYLNKLELSDGAVLYLNNSSNGEECDPTINGVVGKKFSNISAIIDSVKDGVVTPNAYHRLYVLSEEYAIKLGSTLPTDKDTFTPYYLVAKRAPAETGSELLNIESTVDKNVTATLNGTTITINVPATYDSDDGFSLNFETSKLANVYTTFTAPSTTGWELFSDLGSAETTNRSMFKVAGTDNELYVFVPGTKNQEKITTSGEGKIHVVAEDGQTSHAYNVKLVINIFIG